MELKGIFLVEKGSKEIVVLYKRDNVMGVGSFETSKDPLIMVDFLTEVESDIMFAKAILGSTEELDFATANITIKLKLNSKSMPGKRVAVLELKATGDLTTIRSSKYSTIKTWLEAELNIKIK